MRASWRAGRSAARGSSGRGGASWRGSWRGKALFVTWAVAIPLLHTPAHVLLVLCVSAVASLALTVTFQLSRHCLEEAITAPSDGPPVRQEWHIHQVEATADFAQGNALIGWYIGGLNHQIEHHLFPRVPHTLHPQLADIVQAARPSSAASPTTRTRRCGQRFARIRGG